MRRVYRFLRSLTLLTKPKSWGPFVNAAELTHFDHTFTVSWSQGGEDLALLSIFGGQKKGTYLDIGAHHPSRFSVTRHLYQRGWSGVNVDANKKLLSEFEKTRPSDINLCFAIGEKSSYEFTIFDEPAISTFNPEWREKFLSESNAVNRVEVVVGRRLRDLYDEFFLDSAVDILTVDAEGADFEVIRSLDFHSLPTVRFPKYLLLETPTPVSEALATPAVKHAVGWGYVPVMILPMSTILRAPGI
jgi:FkbM family methyltransferase